MVFRSRVAPTNGLMVFPLGVKDHNVLQEDRSCQTYLPIKDNEKSYGSICIKQMPIRVLGYVTR